MTATLIVLIILGNTAWLVANVRMSRKINALASVMVAQIGGVETYREAAPDRMIDDSDPREPKHVEFNRYTCALCGWSRTEYGAPASVVKGAACDGCRACMTMHVHASCAKCGGKWLAAPRTKQLTAG